LNHIVGYEGAFCPPEHLQNIAINGSKHLNNSSNFAAFVIPCYDLPGIDVETECESIEKIKEKKTLIT